MVLYFEHKGGRQSCSKPLKIEWIGGGSALHGLYERGICQASEHAGERVVLSTAILLPSLSELPKKISMRL